ncbi:hypothetical protein EMPS_10680 [Entomortierella parvispora]|uniref:Reverse transcriptase domain-containing protein n=1 Tax=Entomortierella parvispora TaxID=205924 RepID=A0A9P3HKL2_9FUNG|nr:hypothetical protein EMPS_10680 [Entomortierella parvispora]
MELPAPQDGASMDHAEHPATQDGASADHAVHPATEDGASVDHAEHPATQDGASADHNGTPWHLIGHSLLSDTESVHELDDYDSGTMVISSTPLQPALGTQISRLGSPLTQQHRHSQYPHWSPDSLQPSQSVANMDTDVRGTPIQTVALASGSTLPAFQSSPLRAGQELSHTHSSSPRPSSVALGKRRRAETPESTEPDSQSFPPGADQELSRQHMSPPRLSSAALGIRRHAEGCMEETTCQKEQPQRTEGQPLFREQAVELFTAQLAQLEARLEVQLATQLQAVIQAEVTELFRLQRESNQAPLTAEADSRPPVIPATRVQAGLAKPVRVRIDSVRPRQAQPASPRSHSAARSPAAVSAVASQSIRLPKQEPRQQLTLVLLAKVLSGPLKVFKAKLRGLRICTSLIYNISFVGKSMCEFLVDAAYRAKFIESMKSFTFRHLPNYDPAVPQDPNVTEETAELLRGAYIRRLETTASTTNRDFVRDDFLSMLAAADPTAPTSATDLPDLSGPMDTGTVAATASASSGLVETDIPLTGAASEAASAAMDIDPPLAATATASDSELVDTHTHPAAEDTAVLLGHLLESDASKLHHTQAGFRNGFSTLTHALVADDCAIRGQKYRVFYDFAQAYDTVPVPLLLSKMKTRGASAQILSLVDALFVGTSTKVIVNGRQTESIPLSRGLLQGSILSPLLFDIFIDDLAHKLNKDTPDPKKIPRALLYADDITAGSHALHHLQVTSNDLVDWCHENGMTINLAKCGVVGLTHGDRDLVLRGIGPIPRVECYNYLGFPYKSRGIDWAEHLKSMALKASKTLKFCEARGNSKWSAGLRLALYRAFVRSRMEYGAGIMYHWIQNDSKSRTEHLKAIATVQDAALKWILEFKDPTKVTHSFLALPTIYVRFSDLACLLTDHFIGMDGNNPARTLRDVLFGNVGRNKDRILPKCHKHPDRLLYQNYLARLRREEKVDSLKVWLRKRFLDECFRTLRLCKYFEPQMRTRGIGPVTAIYFKSLRLRKNAIAWHLNKFACGARCSECNNIFHQTHVVDCGWQEKLLDRAPPKVVATFLALPPLAPNKCRPNFVDFLLKERHLASLAEAFGWLEFWMRPRENYDV